VENKFVFREQILIVVIVFSLALFFLRHFLRAFRAPKIFVVSVFPLALFSFGFALRLRGEKEVVDLGFFFTDFAFLFTYVLFAAALLLGQIRYWKKI
jgi:hypothetical protein